MGFCVASTKNGSASLRISPPAVTLFSCMASSMADCVFGVARLISSARTMWAKIGPRWNSNARRPSGVSMTMFVPRMSAGIRSGVNWTRLKESSSTSLSVRTSSVLPSPGTPSSNTWPPAKIAVSVPSTMGSAPTMTLPISARRASQVWRKDWILASVLMFLLGAG